MKVSPLLHVRHHGPVLATLARTALSAVIPRRPGQAPPPEQGPEHTAVVPPRPGRLVRDYVRHVGGDPACYRHRLPFHLFPQWGVPLLAGTLQGLPYNLVRVINAGTTVTINRALPPGQPLHLRARLERVDADDRRVVLHQRLATGTEEEPEALLVQQRALIRLSSGKRGPARERPRVPADVRQAGRFRAARDSGLQFALLTGDFNPLHWIPAYARAAGYPGPILHGFSTLARAVELLNRNLWAGEVDRLRWIEVRFTRPLPLPAEAGVYLRPGAKDDQELFVGRLPGGPAYMTGRFRAA